MELEILRQVLEMGAVGASLAGMLLALRSAHRTIRDLAWLLAGREPPPIVNRAFSDERSGASPEENA